MKVPLLPIHVVTSETLEARLDAAFDSGVIAGKGYSQTQIRKLLGNNPAGPVSLRGLKRKEKK